MLYGIGCDLCEIAHLEKSLTGAHAAAFIRRVYGEAERAALSLDEPLPAGRSAAHRLASAAANFAAKEAFLKAAGTGLREPFSLCEIEAVRLESGAPAYHFSGQTAEWMQAHGLAARLSLSHEGGIHARPAGLLVKTVKGFASSATLEKDGKSCDMRKLMALMGMGVKQGETVTVKVEGDDEEAAAAAIQKFLTENV